MNKEQFEQLFNLRATPKIIGIHDLQDRTPRTLMFGYDTDRMTHHVYIGQDGEIHRMSYRPRGDGQDPGKPRFIITWHILGDATENASYVPNKRLYPESCDFEFCALLRKEGVNMSFANYDEARVTPRKERHQPYAGFTHHDGGVRVADLSTKVSQEPLIQAQLYPKTLARRLVVQACRELDVLHEDSVEQEKVFVDVGKTDAVTEKVLSLAETLPKELLEDRTPGRSLFDEVFGYGHYPDIGSLQYNGGELTFSAEGAPSKYRDGLEVTEYAPSDKGLAYPKAISGLYEGRPYVVIFRIEGKCAEFTLSQFGDGSRLTDELSEFYQLAPVVTA